MHRNIAITVEIATTGARHCPSSSINVSLISTLPALFVFEYLLTLQHEIEYVWKRKKRTGSIIFLVNRYVVLVNRGLKMIQAVSWGEKLHRRVSDMVSGL